MTTFSISSRQCSSHALSFIITFSVRVHSYHTQKTDRTGATKGGGGKSPSRGGSSSPGRSRGSPGKGQGPPGSKADLSLTQELQKEMKADNIADILKRTATAGIADEKRKM